MEQLTRKEAEGLLHDVTSNFCGEQPHKELVDSILSTLKHGVKPLKDWTDDEILTEIASYADTEPTHKFVIKEKGETP